MKSLHKKILACAGIILIIFTNFFLFSALFSEGPFQIGLIMVCGIVVLAMFGFHLSRNKAIDIKKIMGVDDDENGK
jgi:hypothetical protein